MALQIPWHSEETWKPNQFLRFEESLDTSMGTARIVTDAGKAYIKAMREDETPHLLAIEFIATRLAKWFKLPVLDFGVISIDESVDEIPFIRGSNAISGPAFVTNAIHAHPWSGAGDDLKKLINPRDISRLVVFDTWVRNCDRYSCKGDKPRCNFDNVLLEELQCENDGDLKLIAMDHTHCFTCGKEITTNTRNIDNVKDETLFGLFPGFSSYVDKNEVEIATNDLRELKEPFVRKVVDQIPDEWSLSNKVKDALVDLIVRRAAFVADSILPKIARQCWPDKLFDA